MRLWKWVQKIAIIEQNVCSDITGANEQTIKKQLMALHRSVSQRDKHFLNQLVKAGVDMTLPLRGVTALSLSLYLKYRASCWKLWNVLRHCAEHFDFSGHDYRNSGCYERGWPATKGPQCLLSGQRLTQGTPSGDSCQNWPNRGSIDTFKVQGHWGRKEVVQNLTRQRWIIKNKCHYDDKKRH